MILKKLKFGAFGPYAGEEEIDFDGFSKDYIFLITGDNWFVGNNNI